MPSFPDSPFLSSTSFDFDQTMRSGSNSRATFIASDFEMGAVPIPFFKSLLQLNTWKNTQTSVELTYLLKWNGNHFLGLLNLVGGGVGGSLWLINDP